MSLGPSWLSFNWRHWVVQFFCILPLSLGAPTAIPFKVRAFGNQNNSSQTSQPSLITITTQEWAPYHTQRRDDAGKLHTQGYGITALDCVMAKMDQPYKVIFLPWGRAQNSVKKQKYDAFFSASRNEWRDQFAVLSNTFIQQEWNFYFHKHYKIPQTDSRLKTDTIFGARIHSNSAHWLIKQKFQRVKTYPSITELVKLLMARRIDAVMENALLFDEHLRQSGIASDTFVMRRNIRFDLGVYFGKHFLKKYPDFLSQFNRYTNECRFSYP